MEEQAVAGTNERETPVSEDNSAQDDLDSLLNQYEKETSPKPETPVKAEQPDKVAELTKIVDQMVYQKDMGEAINAVKGGLDVDNDLVEAWINTQAKDSRFAKAWVNRQVDSGSYQKILKGLGKKFQENYNKPKAPSGDELEAAVHSSTETAPTKTTGDDFGKKLANMSPQEWEKQRQEWGA